MFCPACGESVSDIMEAHSVGRGPSGKTGDTRSVVGADVPRWVVRPLALRMCRLPRHGPPARPGLDAVHDVSRTDVLRFRT